MGRVMPFVVVWGACQPSDSVPSPEAGDSKLLAQELDCELLELEPSPCCDLPDWESTWLGDMNFDGDLDISDVLIVGAISSQRTLAGQQTAAARYNTLSFLADIDFDGAVDSQDYDALVGYLFYGTHDEPAFVCGGLVSSSI